MVQKRVMTVCLHRGVQSCFLLNRFERKVLVPGLGIKIIANWLCAINKNIGMTCMKLHILHITIINMGK